MLKVALCFAAVTSVSAVTRQNTAVGPMQNAGDYMQMIHKNQQGAGDEINKHLQGAGGQILSQMEKQEMLVKYKFKNFVKDFKRMYVPGSDEWKARESTFKKNLQLLQDHHTGPEKTWTVGINKFMDYSETEYNKLLGYKSAKSKKPMSLMQSLDADDGSDISLTKSWLPNMPKAKTFFKDQGACGSCWAIATATALEGHIEIAHGDSSPLSSQMLVSCVPNPQQCGGQGGCQGATAEMAFEYIRANGMPSEQHWPYVSYTGTNGNCNPTLQALKHVAIDSWVQLPENKGIPLLRALYEKGPVVVSADASDFGSYQGGIFAGCSKDAILNHAITAEGYGEQNIGGTNHKYYLIRNSWGQNWGEGGYIRLARFDDDAHWCGVDSAPLEGTGCLGGPATVNVCGMCGVLYDSSYPVGASFITTAQGGTYAGVGQNQNFAETAGVMMSNLFKR